MNVDKATLQRRLAVLKRVPLFSDLSDLDRETLIEDFRLRRYAKNEIIFRQGDESRELYVVLQGKVRIFRISPAGGETSIDIFSSHDIIGELAAIDNQPRSATAKAISDVELLAISHERFLYHLRTMPDLALSLARLLSQKLRWTSAYAESVAQLDAAGRLLHILLYYTERYGEAIEPGKRYRVELALNQTDLASMVGARREWVNRLLNDWRKRGLLEYTRGVLTIHDLPRMQAERDSRTEANQASSAW